MNIAEEILNVIALSANYTYATAYAGDFTFSGALQQHHQARLHPVPGDTPINYLENPFYSTEFKTKENVTLTWNFHKFGTTFYVERYGKTATTCRPSCRTRMPRRGAARLDSWTIANLSAKYEVLPGLTVSANVDNLFNRAPPTDNSYPGTTLQAVQRH